MLANPFHYLIIARKVLVLFCLLRSPTSGRSKKKKLFEIGANTNDRLVGRRFVGSSVCAYWLRIADKTTKLQSDDQQQQQVTSGPEQTRAKSI